MKKYIFVYAFSFLSCLVYPLIIGMVSREYLIMMMDNVFILEFIYCITLLIAMIIDISRQSRLVLKLLILGLSSYLGSMIAIYLMQRYNIITMC